MSLGATLQGLFNSPGAGIAPPYDGGAAPAPQASGQMSRGQIIAGIIADALAGAAGQPGAFGQMLDKQRQQQQDEVQWQRRRAEGVDDYRQKQAIDQQYAKPAEAPQIVRLQQIYDDPNTPPSIRATVKAAIDAQTNPVISLPGGGMGLRSTVTGMMGGGGAPPPATLPPDFDFGAGGPTQPGSGTFR